jgi:phage portal protein BeeE
MKILNRLSAAIKVLRGFEDYDDEKYLEYISGEITKAGIRINEANSLTISAVYSAINIIAGTIASLPKVIYRRLGTGGKERAFDHPLYDRLHNKPNSSNLTSWQWIFTQIVHKYLWGNWYTYIDIKSHRNREFIPLLPDRTYLDPITKDRYVTVTEKMKTLYIEKYRMLHIPHFSLNGETGKGVIHYARESLGISKALDEFAGTFFGSGIHPGGFVEVGEMKVLKIMEKKRLLPLRMRQITALPHCIMIETNMERLIYDYLKEYSLKMLKQLSFHRMEISL